MIDELRLRDLALWGSRKTLTPLEASCLMVGISPTEHEHLATYVAGHARSTTPSPALLERWDFVSTAVENAHGLVIAAMATGDLLTLEDDMYPRDMIETAHVAAWVRRTGFASEYFRVWRPPARGYSPPELLTYYTPLEGAIRWCGYLKDEAEIKHLYSNTSEDILDLSEWPHLDDALERIAEGVNEDTLREGLGSPTGKFTHHELRRWIRAHFPDQRPAFLFAGPFNEELNAAEDRDGDDEDGEEAQSVLQERLLQQNRELSAELEALKQANTVLKSEVERLRREAASFTELTVKHDELFAAQANKLLQLELKNQELAKAATESPASQYKSARTNAENSLLKIVSALCNDAPGFDFGSSGDVSEIVKLCAENGYPLDTGTVKKWRDEILERFPRKA